MLVRKAAFLASVSSGFLGISQADAGCFGKRRCCTTAPVVCAPCPPPVIQSPIHSPPPITNYYPSPVIQSWPAQQFSGTICGDICNPCYSPMPPMQAQFRTETHTRIVSIQKMRTETRQRTVVENGSMRVENYQVQVPYTEQVEQTFQVQVPVASSIAQAVSESADFEQFLLNGTEVLIPANVSDATKTAFKDLYKELLEAKSRIQKNDGVDVLQQDSINDLLQK